MEKKKEEVPTHDRKKTAKKKTKQLELALKAKQGGISKMRYKSQLLVALCFIATMSLVSSIYHARPVARLPFTPFGVVQGVTHRGLVGADPLDCSYAFIYVLSSMCLKQMMARALGFAPRGVPAPSMFPPMPEEPAR